MLHQKYKRRTDYCCCTGTVHCRYCVGQGKPPHLTVDKDYNTVSIESKAYMDERKQTLIEVRRKYQKPDYEPVNELENMTETQRLNTQANFIIAVRKNYFVVGSVDDRGTMSFASNPVVHGGASAARAECARLAKLNPGKLYIFVQLAGGEMVPATQTVSI